MNIREYIESGILELYVFGLLTEEENAEIRSVAAEHPNVQEEIIAIEKAVINLSYSISPKLSAANYEKIRARLADKTGQQDGVVVMKPRAGISSYIGWAAALVLLCGIIFQYLKYNEATQQVQQATAERGKFEAMVAGLQKKNADTENMLSLLRSREMKAVPLEGQQAAPESFAKVYMNSSANEIYVDVSGLPEPPEGKVYQVWALKLTPLTPTSIGIVNDIKSNRGMIKVDGYNNPEGFGITLEPAGGSATPTMDQLYALGKV